MPSNPDAAEVRPWAQAQVDLALQRFPGRERYTVAAGASPSGRVHFGNFRDVMTAFAVVRAFAEREIPVRLLFSWDDFDRFRKVPAGVDSAWEQHVGRPLSEVPDPLGEVGSYAARYEAEFEAAIAGLGIELEIRRQSEEYATGRYDPLVLQAMHRRREIAEVLFAGMSEKRIAERGLTLESYAETFFPLSVYSQFTGKDATDVLEFDGEHTVRYRCRITKQESTLDLLAEHRAKLQWKVDWPMRWLAEDVAWEPGGADHAGEGGSYSQASILVERVFDRPAPAFLGYGFVGIRGLGSKMSGSKGGVVTPGDLLDIYEPALLRWLYLRRAPDQTFQLAFDTEVYRQYDEWDRELAAARRGELSPVREQAVRAALAGLPEPPERPIPFRQAVAFGQVVGWDPELLVALVDRLGFDHDPRALAERAERARAWLQTYNPGEAIALLEEVNVAHVASMDDARLERVRRLRGALAEGMDADEPADVDVLDELVYGIPKEPGIDEAELKARQKTFFSDVYGLLLGRSRGPRLSTFLWAADRPTVVRLLDVDAAAVTREMPAAFGRPPV